LERRLYVIAKILMVLGLLVASASNVSIAENASAPLSNVDADEYIWLDTASAYASSNTTAAVGQRVFIILKGTYSAWPTSWWGSGVCKGAPEGRPMYPTGPNNGAVGLDPLFMFASPRGSTYCSRPETPPAASLTPFEVSLNGGQSWFRPTPNSTTAEYNSRHEYLFNDIDGQGHRPRFRINDHDISDNYGFLSVFIHVYTPTAAPPAAPSNLRQVGASSRSVTLQWNDNSNNEEGFYIEEYDYSYGDWVEEARPPAGTTIYVYDYGVSCARPSRLRVVAWNRDGRSQPSNVIDASPSGCTPPTQPPAPPTSAPNPTPVTPAFNIQVVDLQWQSPPAAYIEATLVVKMRVVGLPSGWRSGYLLNLLIDQGALARPLNFWFDSEDPDASQYLSTSQLQNGDLEVRVSKLRLPTLFSGRMSVTVISAAKDDVRGALVRPLTVASSPEAYRHCYEVLFFGVTQFLPSDVRLAAKVTKKTIQARESAARCGDRATCVAETLVTWVQDLDLAQIDYWAGKSPPGKIAVLLKNAILALPDTAKCAVWFKDETVAAYKLLNSRGIRANEVATGSPVYPLVVTSAGQRAGFLPNGQVVEEIPGSQAVAVEEKRFVFYPDEADVTVEIVGYGPGTMNVDTVFAQNGGSVASYNKVPVSQGMKATLSSSDQQGTLNIDTNGDGKVDQVRAPDVREVLSGPQPPPPGGGGGSYTFKETGFAVSGRIWQVWQNARSFEDSLYINGFPITSLRAEINATDGKTYQTQWFERARFELHPENQPPYDVLFGLLGTHIALSRQSEAPFKPVGNLGGGIPWFRETQHTLGDSGEGGRAIAGFWNRLGGLQQFGFPLSQPFMEKSKDDGKTYLVQYFERQRFEYHPENKGTRYEVLLGRLGAEQVNQKPPSQGQTQVSILKQGDDVEGVAFSPDSTLLASCGQDVKLWRTTDGALLRTFNHGAGVGHIAYSPDGQILASMSGLDQSIKLWRVADGSSIRVIPVGHSYLFDLAFSRDGQLIAAGVEKSVRVWRVSDGALLRTLAASSGMANRVAFTPDGQFIIASLQDGSIRKWNLSDGSEVRVTFLQNHDDFVHSMTFSPDGQYLALGLSLGSIEFWRASDFQRFRAIQAHHRGAGTLTGNLAFSGDGQLIASTGQTTEGEWEVNLWKTSDGTPVKTLDKLSKDLTWLSLAFSPDGRVVAVGSSDGNVRLWTVR
jgi:WD40 repeat protein